MGLKRVSWIAEVMAYEARPVAMGRVSKVPMQPRREREEDESGEMVFHVTNKGDSEIALERCDVRRGCKPTGTNDDSDEAGVVAAVLGDRLVEDAEAGVELPDGEDGGREAERRWRAGMRGPELVEGLFGVSASSRSASAECSSSSSPFG